MKKRLKQGHKVLITQSIICCVLALIIYFLLQWLDLYRDSWDIILILTASLVWTMFLNLFIPIKYSIYYESQKDLNDAINREMGSPKL